MDIFEKTQTQESSKLKQKTQTQAENLKKLKPQNSIMGNFTQIIEFHKSKSHFMRRFQRFLAQSLVFIWKTQAQKSIFRQIHLVYMPKRGPISKPDLHRGQVLDLIFTIRALQHFMNLYDIIFTIV